LQAFKGNVQIFYLIDGMLTYLLGAAIPSYLGITINIRKFFVGYVLIILVLLIPAVIRSYFAHARDMEGAGAQGVKNQLGVKWMLLAFLSALLVLMTLTIIVLFNFEENPLTAWVFLGLVISLSVVNPVFSQSGKGLAYNGIVNGIIIAFLIPAFSLTLNLPELHRLLLLLTLPLLMIYWGCNLALGFEKYGSDLKSHKPSMLIVLGWQKGVFLHNIFILIGFLIIGLEPLIGISWSLVWPQLIMVLVGIFQIWQVQQISEGRKPQWRLLWITANFLFIFCVYMLLFALWIN